MSHYFFNFKLFIFHFTLLVTLRDLFECKHSNRSILNLMLSFSVIQRTSCFWLPLCCPWLHQLKSTQQIREDLMTFQTTFGSTSIILSRLNLEKCSRLLYLLKNMKIYKKIFRTILVKSMKWFDTYLPALEIFV